MGKYGKYTLRKDGRIEKRYNTGCKNPVTGKTKYLHLYAKSEKEMDDIISKLNIEKCKGVDVSAGNDTFKTWGDMWYRIKSPRVAESQRINLDCHLKHIYNFFGALPINKVKPYNIDDMLCSLAEYNPTTGRPMAKKTLRDIRNTAANVFDLAIDNDAIYKNPARGREIPENAPVTKRRDLTDTEQQWVVNTPHRARIGALIMMYAGLRKGELIPLRWNDIDFDNFTITVNKSVKLVKNKYILKSGAKTDAGTRTINIPLDLAEELEKAKKETSSVFICPSKSGEMHTPTTWRVMWNSYISVLNFENGTFMEKPKNRLGRNNAKIVIDKITPHMLRHTYASLLYASGVDVLTAARLLGHADVKTTLGIYTHLKEKSVDNSIDKFDEYVRQIVVKKNA